MPSHTFASETTFALNNDWGVIRASGADARGFLHAQLTQDVLHLADNEVRLAAYCSAKGRMYAIFHVWAVGETVYLLTHRSVIDTVIQRLRMFVLRAKVVLENVSDTYDIRGFVGASALNNEQAVHENGITRLGVLPAFVEGTNEPSAREIQLHPASEPTQIVADASLWNWLNIRAGIAYVTEDIREAFVPQMLNLERIDGVNFKKGCYPGQEIVARSHYLGKLKRRMQAAHVMFANNDARANALSAWRIGMDVFASSDPAQPAGQLVAFAAHPQDDRRVDVLYEVSLPLLADDAQIRVSDDRPAFIADGLPYSLSDE